MGQGNYEDEFCRGCRRLVDSLMWVAKLHTSVCRSCLENFQAENPTWRLDEAKERMDKAHELYLHEKAEYEKLVAEGK